MARTLTSSNKCLLTNEYISQSAPEKQDQEDVKMCVLAKGVDFIIFSCVEELREGGRGEEEEKRKGRRRGRGGKGRCV